MLWLEKKFHGFGIVYFNLHEVPFSAMQEKYKELRSFETMNKFSAQSLTSELSFFVLAV